MSAGDFSYVYRDACRRHAAYVFVTALFSLGFSDSVHGASKAPVQPPPEESASRIEKQPDGTQVTIIRWAVGTPDNIISLRIPAGYTSLADFGPGAYLADKAYKDRKPPSVARGFLFAGLYPGMQKRTPENFAEFTVPGGGRVINGLVKAGLYGGADGPEKLDAHRVYAGWRKVQLEQLIFVPAGRKAQFSLKELPSVHGLRRLGVDPVRPYMAISIVPPDDFYFVGDKAEESPFFITCTTDAVKDPQEDPGSTYVPHCSHNFAFTPLSARIKLHYRRIYLGSWREIQQQVEQVLASFISETR